jgi:hypothetical protein
MYSALTGWAVQLDCGDQAVKGHCRIFLPPQSLLGRYEDLQDQPNGAWTASFLCLRHGHLSIRNSGNVHPEIGDSPIANFYRIEAECGRENCGKLHTFFAAGQPDCEVVRLLSVNSMNAISCNEHDLLWKDSQVTVTQLFP